MGDLQLPGTNIPVYNKLFYNSRGQLAEIREGLTPNNTSWQRGAIINFYDTCWGMCWNPADNSFSSMPNNNGNLKTQQVFISQVDAADYDQHYDVFSQSYDYDYLNRLRSVNEGSWQQKYAYDRFGNRTIDVNNTYGSGIPKPNFTVDATKNQLGVPVGQSGTMSYDPAGNLTTDTYSAAAVTRLYDAENRMTKETQAGSYDAGIYSYNGDGQRVRRNVGGTETWQVYGLGGELLAEYAANTPAVSPKKEYGYRNGQLLVTVLGSGSELQATWDKGSKVKVTASGNSLTKTATGLSSWNAGAASEKGITIGDGYMEFTASEMNKARRAGLSNGDSNQNWDDIDFCIFLDSNGTVSINEGSNLRGSFGSYASGDRFRVVVEGGVVKYRRNGTLLHEQ